MRLFAGEAQQDGAVGAVALAGESEEPCRETFTRATRVRPPPSTISSRKRRAATIGPTVWELDGPMPILNRSKTLVDICEPDVK